MENTITELSLDETLKFLEKERIDLLAEDLKNKEKVLIHLDNLIKKTNYLMLEQDLQSKILVGSLVSLLLNYGNGEYETVDVKLGFDLNENTINILSPLGYAIFGATVGETKPYQVNGFSMEATILSKNVLVEELPQNLELSNSCSGPVKKKTNN